MKPLGEVMFQETTEKFNNTPTCLHKKVYKNSVVFKENGEDWICSDCMETGRDNPPNVEVPETYEQLMRKKNKFLTEG